MNNPYQALYRSKVRQIQHFANKEKAEEVVRQLGLLYNTIGVSMKDISRIMSQKFQKAQKTVMMDVEQRPRNPMMQPRLTMEFIHQEIKKKHQQSYDLENPDWKEDSQESDEISVWQQNLGISSDDSPVSVKNKEDKNAMENQVIQIQNILSNAQAPLTVPNQQSPQPFSIYQVPVIIPSSSNAQIPKILDKDNSKVIQIDDD